MKEMNYYSPMDLSNELVPAESLHPTTEMVTILMNRREELINCLSKNYSYEYLLNLFKDIEKMELQIEPDNKHIYRLFSGSYKNNKNFGSAISWVPSSEFVDMVVSMAEFFQIDSIEEICAGLGVISSLIKRKCPKINVTASDPFNNKRTCNQLGFIPIAHRGIEDFKYYPQLNAPYPSMIISSYSNQFIGNTKKENQFIDQLSELIQSNNHKIIIIVIPKFVNLLHEILHNISLDGEYQLCTHYVKAFDKYFFLSRIFEKYYPSNLIMHIMIKKSIVTGPFEINKFIERAVLPSSNPIWHNSHLRWFLQFMDIFSEKLIKNIFKKLNFKNTLHINNFFEDIIMNLSMLDKIKIKHIPQYIYSTEEFIFWSNLIIKKNFLCFDNRFQFFDFYNQCNNQTILNNIPFTNYESKFMYIYLEIVIPNKEWKKNQRTIQNAWNNINDKNQKFLLETHH